MNAGIEATPGRYVLALNPDCRLEPDGGEAAGLRLGQWRSWSDILFGAPRTLVRDGQDYVSVWQVSHARPVGLVDGRFL